MVFTEESMTFKVLCIVLESVLESNKTLYPVYHQVMLASKLIIHWYNMMETERIDDWTTS